MTSPFSAFTTCHCRPFELRHVQRLAVGRDRQPVGAAFVRLVPDRLARTRRRSRSLRERGDVDAPGRALAAIPFTFSAGLPVGDGPGGDPPDEPVALVDVEHEHADAAVLHVVPRCPGWRRRADAARAAPAIARAAPPTCRARGGRGGRGDVAWREWGDEGRRANVPQGWFDSPDILALRTKERGSGNCDHAGRAGSSRIARLMAGTSLTAACSPADCSPLDRSAGSPLAARQVQIPRLAALARDDSGSLRSLGMTGSARSALPGMPPRRPHPLIPSLPQSLSPSFPHSLIPHYSSISAPSSHTRSGGILKYCVARRALRDRTREQALAPDRHARPAASRAASRGRGRTSCSAGIDVEALRRAAGRAPRAPPDPRRSRGAPITRSTFGATRLDRHAILVRARGPPRP